MKRITRALAMTLLLLTLLTTAVSAASPYATYTYSSTGFVLESPDAYVSDAVIDPSFIGEGLNFQDPRDITVDPDNNVYIVDGALNTVYVMDRYYKLKFTLSSFINEQGVPDSFSGPSGAFINEKYIYVCDTDNNRIVIFDREGNFKKIVAKPESSLFSQKDIYKPVAVAVDSYGRLFIVSSTTYQGIIVMSDKGDFYGFIGAQKVSISAFELIRRKFRSDAQAKYEDTIVSTEYNNITIDKYNFIYVTTSSIDEGAQQGAITGKSKSGDYAPVKKLNASGKDVMSRNGFYPPSGEVRTSSSRTATITGASKIIDAAVGPEGTWSIIDEKRSKVFTYDDDGNLLFAFGDMGNQAGNIAGIRGIVYQGDKILLLDKSNKNFTVYRRTEYGDILIRALENQNNRKFDQAVNDWTEILKRNNNFDLAYVGIGKALAKNGDYDKAMTYFEASYDTARYSDAYKEVRKEWATSYFWIIPIIIVGVVILLSRFFGYAAKRNKQVSLRVGQKRISEELLYIFHLILHPFDGFWDLKHEHRGSIRSAFIILIATILAFFYQSVGSGYIFGGSARINGTIISTMISVVVPLLLWVVANWCLTTLFEGEGTFKDIFTATCYAIAPLPMLVIPSVFISNFLVQNEMNLITTINSVAWIWVGLLLFFGMAVTHGYSIFKNFITTLGTIVGAAFIMFVGILFSTLMVKIINFISGIVVELEYRM